MPGWLWDSIFQYPLAEGDTRTQYSDGSTFVGPLKDGKRHGKGAYFFQDGSRCVAACYDLCLFVGSVVCTVLECLVGAAVWCECHHA